LDAKDFKKATEALKEELNKPVTPIELPTREKKIKYEKTGFLFGLILYWPVRIIILTLLWNFIAVSLLLPVIGWLQMGAIVLSYTLLTDPLSIFQWWGKK